MDESELDPKSVALIKKLQGKYANSGTNWQKYLPPRFQKISFFPQLWSRSELDNRGRSWVMKEVFQKYSEDIR